MSSFNLKIFQYIDIFLTIFLIVLFSSIAFNEFHKNMYKSIIPVIVLIFFLYNLLNKIILLFNYKLFYKYNFFLIIKKKHFGYTVYTILGLLSVILLGFTTFWFISFLIALSLWLTILLLKSKIKEKP